MSRVRYTLPARLLHWLVAVGIVAAFVLALSFDGMPFSMTKLKLINYHKWIGITVLALVAARLLWRLGHKPPPLPAATPLWQVWAAHITHAFLYVLMFAIPLGGWLMSSAKGFPVVYLGVLPLPDLVGPNPELGTQLRSLHELGAWGLIVLALGHAAAAIKHHLIDRDDVLKRML